MLASSVLYGLCFHPFGLDLFGKLEFGNAVNTPLGRSEPETCPCVTVKEESCGTK